MNSATASRLPQPDQPLNSSAFHTDGRAARIVRGDADDDRVSPSTPADADLPHRLLWLTEELDAHRGAAGRPIPESADDLPDPHHGGSHPDVFVSLLSAVETLCAPLRPQYGAAAAVNRLRR